MPSPRHYIQLLNGAAYDPREQRHEPPQDYDIEHIAYVLSGTRRFNAITRYTVAQHCVIGSHIAPKRQQYTFLMHDACEAFTGFGDVPAPLKEGWLKEREHWITTALAEQFRFEYPFTQTIHRIDARMQATEKRDLLALADWWSVDAEPYEWRIGDWDEKVVPLQLRHCMAEVMEPKWIMEAFLARHEELKP